MIALLFDTETTGLINHRDLKPRIIEIACVVANEDGMLEEYGQLINPGILLTEETTKITGITNDDVKDAPTFAEIVPKLVTMFGPADLLVAHNLPFDRAMLQSEVDRIDGLKFPWPADAVCTVQEYTPAFGFTPNMKVLYEHIFGRPLAQKHRALDDVRALYELLKADNFFAKIGVV